VSIFTDDAHFDETTDRRVAVRRKEDFFWLKRLADLTGEVCVVVDRDLGIQYVDEKIFELINIEPIDAKNLTHLNQLTSIMAEQGYFGNGDPKVFEALISDLLVNQRLKQSGPTQIINAVTPSGRHIDIRVSLGRDDSYVLLMRDVTHQELEKQALDTALQVGQSGYWYFNLQSQEFRVRADWLEDHFSDANIEKIRKKGFTHVLHRNDRHKSKDVIDRAVETRVPQMTKVRILSDDGATHWIKAQVMPNMDESGTVQSVCCFFSMITQQVRIEQDLRDAQTKAETALKAKNEFLGRLSHEVRTPLNAVVGMADALVHNCKDTSILPQLTLIQSSAEKVIEMVESTLEHTKLAEDAIELNLRECSPGKLVETICRSWKDKAAIDNTKLSFAIHPDVPKTMSMDGFRYEQCLNNLLSNAIKFTPGGTVKVILAPKGHGDNQQLILAVRDSGIGIKEGSLTHIFQPFKQADKSISSRFGGTGLGLAIVKDLIELMGGRINVSSEYGKGTLFAIALPVNPSHVSQNVSQKPITTQSAAPTEVNQSEAADEQPHASPEPAAEPPQGSNAPDERSLVDRLLDKSSSKATPYDRLSILIVDDNATNHIVVSSLLSRVVGEITTALNGKEALDQLKQKKFDLVLMDIHMPVMDGIETTLAIRSEPSDYQHVPIIALTADPQYQQARLCRNIGMNSSLGKPIKLTGLLQAFDEVLFSKNNDIASAA
jgi:signal transduction histidine kinase/ActR/RegA family two-component response regulator